jgi:septal ring factor EnvC (AmiA/AmiB activator)
MSVRILAPLRRLAGGPGLCRGALALALALALPLVAADEGARQEQIRGTRAQLRQLRHEREQLKSNLERYAGKAETTLAEIESLTQLVRDSKRRERELLRLRDDLLREQAVRERRMEEIRARIAAAKARIGANLRNVYRLSKVEEAASLIMLALHKTYFKDTAYLSRLTRLDREALAGYHALTGDLAQAEEEARRALEEQTAVMETLISEQAQLVESQRVLLAVLADIRRNQQLSEAYLKELDQSMTGMEATLAKLEAEPPPEHSLDSLPDPASLKGRLPPPVAGTVIAAFGRQDPRFALKKFQRGIVIAVAEGAPVAAVAAGKAVHAGPFRGYEELVVLDHGRGLFSVYGHLEQLSLQRGAWVEAGAVLGRATYQSIDNGYSVYFEVRTQGAPEDPLAWIEPGRLTLAESAARD